MAEKQITGLGTKTVPLNRTTKGSELFELLAVNATFDGTGAGGSWVPVVEVISDSGKTVGTFPAALTLGIGDSVEVTFAPFLRNGVGLTGVYYDFLNVGGFLNVRTTNNLNPDNGGVTFEVEKSEFGVYVTDAATGAFHVEAPFVFYDVGGGTYRVSNSSLFDVDADAVVFGPSDSFTAQTVHASVNIDADETVRVHLHTGKPLLVEDHLGNPIFKVDENGDLHGKTGKALVFDL